MSDKGTTLLQKLLATVDDERLFGMTGAEDPERCRVEIREILTALYGNAAQEWDWHIAGDIDLEKREYEGVLLFEKYAADLLGCPVEEYIDAIRFVADGRVVTRMGVEVRMQKSRGLQALNREFLYFMIGYMAQGIEEARRRLGVRAAANRQGQD